MRDLNYQLKMLCKHSHEGSFETRVGRVSWSGSSAPTLTLIKNENSRKSPAIGRRENLKSV